MMSSDHMRVRSGIQAPQEWRADVLSLLPSYYVAAEAICHPPWSRSFIWEGRGEGRKRGSRQENIDVCGGGLGGNSQLLPPLSPPDLLLTSLGPSHPKFTLVPFACFHHYFLEKRQLWKVIIFCARSQNKIRKNIAIITLQQSPLS